MAMPLYVDCFVSMSGGGDRLLVARDRLRPQQLPAVLVDDRLRLVVRVAYGVVPSSPYSHGLQTSTVHSSFAFSSTRSLPEVNA